MKNNLESKNKINKRWIGVIIGLSIIAFIFFAPATLSFFFKEKIWAHRVNSLEKLKEATPLFNGVELDVMFDLENNYFDVNHPPAKSIQLSLEKYLTSLPNPTSLKYWLDFKNLNVTNQQMALERLEALVDRFKLKPQQVIIESSNPEFLAIFQQKEYIVSFYLPAGMHKMPPQQLAITIEAIKTKLANNEEIYISSLYKDYYIMKEYFPERKKLLWNLFYDIYPYRGELYHMLMDEKVEVMLLTFWAREGNR